MLLRSTTVPSGVTRSESAAAASTQPRTTIAGKRCPTRRADLSDPLISGRAPRRILCTNRLDLWFVLAVQHTMWTASTPENRTVRADREQRWAMRKLPAKLASQLYGAAELIAERGLDGTKIEDIAEATGIPKATIYYHLDGKNAVLEFLLTDLLEMIAGAVGVAVSSAEDARTRLEAAVAAQLGVMLAHPFLCRALVGDLGRATRLPDLAVALRSAFYEPIEKLLADGVADGSLRQVADPGAVALSVFGAITVAGLSAAVEGPSADPSADAARFSAAVGELILDGLATPRPRGGHESDERP